MKLQVDFTGLWSAVRQMGPIVEIDDFKLEFRENKELELDTELSGTAGIEVALDDLIYDNGVLSYQGRQVLLFIPDHHGRVESVLSGEKEGNKFHVSDCQKLNEMRRMKRFDRYRATNNLSGVFKIYGVSNFTNKPVEGEVELHVCKYCLGYLNYQGYKTGQNRKTEIYSNFDIGHFLSHYSTLFTSMPPTSHFVEKGGYADDWAEVSARYRQSKSYQCESCSLDLSQHKQLLHTHHINGNKRQNNAENLKALCIDCHRKQPNHEYMRVKPTDMLDINRLRRDQGLLGKSSWADALKMADTSIHGILLAYQSEGRTAPEIGYEVQDKNHTVIGQLEAAWPKERFGIVVTDDDRAVLMNAGWTVQTVGEALRYFN